MQSSATDPMRDPKTDPPARMEGATLERLRAIGESVGFDFAMLDDDVLTRIRLLARSSQVASDSVRMVRAAETIFAFYEAEKPEQRWNEVERRTVVLACVFSDIGKTGPADADSSGQRLVAEMFAVEGVKDETQSVEAFLRERFPKDAALRIGCFRELGLDPSMTMRTFWNHHAGWTYDIVERGGIPLEAVAAAASHHFLDDINPDGLVGADGRFSRWFGENTRFDRAEKLVIVLDKYDATRRRSALTHDGAIAWLRAWIAKKPRFRDDPELETTIADVETALR